MVENEFINNVIRWIGEGIRKNANHDEALREARVELVYKGKNGKSPEIIIRLNDGNEMRLKISTYVADLQQSMTETWGSRTTVTADSTPPINNLNISGDPQD